MFLPSFSTVVKSRIMTDAASLILLHINKKVHTPILNQVYQNYSSSADSIEENEVSKKGGFAKSFDKFSSPDTSTEQKEQSFLSLLKNSKFIDLGDPEGKVVTGTIFHTVNNDLYVDFGWKFHCVVARPAKNGDEYVRGSKVRLIVKELELSTKFLGSEKDLTLLEADAILIGLISSPARRPKTFAS